MSTPRRLFSAACAALAALALAWSQPARAADYPNKPIRLVVGFTTGSANFVGHILADALGPKLGQNVILDARAGAGQLIAMEYVAKAAPDGYTLMLGSQGGTSLLPGVKRSMPYQMPDAFTYVARVTSSGYVLVTSADKPFRTLRDVMTYAKGSPNGIRFGTSGPATLSDMLGFMLEQSSGAKVSHVPYRGGGTSILTDVISGEVELTSVSLISAAELAAAGKVRVIAYTGAKRDPNAPDVPTMVESGYPDAVVQDWLGVLGPAGLPQDVVTKLQKALVETVSDPAVKERLQKADFDPSPVLGEDFRKQVIQEMATLKGLATKANVVVD